MLTVEQRIDNGIKLLDSHFGPGWEEQIDLDTLELGSTDRCICAQISGTGNFGDGVVLLGLDSYTHSKDYGFGCDMPTQAWKTAILNLEKNRTADREKVLA